VVRAVAGSALPIISAVGHETDVTLCDFAADLRAATPSQAAELAVPERAGLWRRIASCRQRLLQSMDGRVEGLALRLKHCRNARVLRQPEELFMPQAQAVDQLREALLAGVRRKTVWEEHSVQRLLGKLDSLNPLAVLARGYSLTTRADGGLVNELASLAAGDRLKTSFAFGEVYSRVEATKLAEKGAIYAEEKE
jgi:exodeoxyribonuclease VII large subunit